MLKVKDDVDLKELEKYGFHKPHFTTLENVGYENIDGIWIMKEDKKLRITNSDKINGFYDNTLSNSLYDLIKADLIEKVDDK